MENLNFQEVETLGLLLFSVVFFFLEKLFPRNPDLLVKDQIRVDILAFFVLVAGINISRPLVGIVYDAVDLKSFTLIGSSGEWPFALRLLGAHLVSDFCLYWVHRLMHLSPFFWRTHQWHHSVEKMYWFAGFRTSLAHTFLYAFPQVFVGLYLFKFTPIELGIGFVFGIISNLFTHSNLALPSWLPLHWILVTPDFHHPHHSQLGTQNKNFGNVFTIWDRIFGSYVDPSRIRKDFKYGLKESPSAWRMMIGL